MFKIGLPAINFVERIIFTEGGTGLNAGTDPDARGAGGPEMLTLPLKK